MRKLTPKEIGDFYKADAQCFFVSESSKSKTVMFKTEEANVFLDTPLSVTSTLPLPFLTMSKILDTRHGVEVGFLIEIPNLPFNVGRNYVTVTRRNVDKEIIDSNIEIRINVNRFTLLELPDSAVALILDNTGNFQT